MAGQKMNHGPQLKSELSHRLYNLNERHYVEKLIFSLEKFQEKFEWIEEPVDKTIKQGSLDEVTFACKLSHKGKKAKWYLRNQVRMVFSPTKVYFYVVVIC